MRKKTLSLILILASAPAFALSFSRAPSFSAPQSDHVRVSPLIVQTQRPSLQSLVNAPNLALPAQAAAPRVVVFQMTAPAAPLSLIAAGLAVSPALSSLGSEPALQVQNARDPGAWLGRLFEGPVAPAEGSVGGSARPGAQIDQRYTDALAQEIRKTVGGVVMGWSVPHVEKAAFPYQVERQRRIYQPIAYEQTRGNKQRVLSLMMNPDLCRLMLNNLEKQLSGAEVPLRDLGDPVFQAFFKAMSQAAQNLGYDSRGPLVNVGWGSGDHETAHGYTPDGPNSVSRGLANAAVRYLKKP